MELSFQRRTDNKKIDVINLANDNVVKTINEQTANKLISKRRKNNPKQTVKQKNIKKRTRNNSKNKCKTKGSKKNNKKGIQFAFDF